MRGHIHHTFLCQITRFEVHGYTRTCFATVLAQEYFLDVVRWALRFGQDMAKF